MHKISETKMEKTDAAIGDIVAYAGGNVPAGWLPCDHRMLRRHMYPELYKIIGTQYGDGDGSNTAFNLPDLVAPMPDTHYFIFVGAPA